MMGEWARDERGHPEAEVLESVDAAKLLRLGSMVAATLNEVREVELDEAARRHLQDAHRRTVEELEGLMLPELRGELHRDVVLLPDDRVVGEGELRVAQARLIGWLEGLFPGMQATAVSRQLAGQLEALRQSKRDQAPPGQYL